MSNLQIYDRRERLLVGAADAGLAVVTGARRLLRPAPPPQAPRRVLLLRLERIGDLLMTLDAIAAVRELLPAAELDLAVGSWNRDLAALIPGLSRVEIVDAPWLARGPGATSWRAMMARARDWRSRRYDLAINFEGDIRSHGLMALSDARMRVGFAHGGGGPLLSHIVPFDGDVHVAVNALGLVAATGDAFGLADRVRVIRQRADQIAAATGGRHPFSSDGHAVVPGRWPRLTIPDDARERAAALLHRAGPTVSEWIGLHAAGGREIKQWHPDRFGRVAGELALSRGAGIVLTGGAADRSIVDQVRAALPAGVPVLDVTAALDLVTLAALLSRLTALVTGDTGPMHLAAAMGTPIVAIFGPSMPWRYAPLGPSVRLIRIDLPCSPCNRIRLPPERCRGHVPDCLDGIGVEAVRDAALSLLAERATERAP